MALAWLLFVTGIGLLMHPQSAFAQTAQQYFDELLNENAFNHYGDEYVCFPDKDTTAFAILAKTADVERAMAANHEKPPHFPSDALIVQQYFKGVNNGPRIFLKAETDGTEEWALEFPGPPMHGKVVYMINWISGRYRYLVYALDQSKDLPAGETSGVCRLIHPSAPPPSL